MPKILGKNNEKQKKKKEAEILIVAKQNRTGIRMARKLEKELKKYTENVHFDRSTALRLKKRGTPVKKFSGDLVITIGGDGTLLWTSHQTDVPILPIKIEGYGFLCTANFKQLLENLKNVVEGKYEITHRMRLKCIRVRKSKIEKYIDRIFHSEYPFSMNEVTFARKRPSKILELEVKIDGALFDFVGDGVLFSTPAGSTAYGSSAGGSIIDPSLSAITMVPLYPFYSKIKPMILPMDKKIEVTIKGGDCALIIDGHSGDYVTSDSTFIIEGAEPAKIISIVPQNFYEKVRKGLMS
ncbi:MAG: NAD(+)/NADH kinase [Candidatus Aenigmarchaeota archaeon]|nr:NAD(+)/NADH kinase [Candidatus Aenigmarchaeota archaeon]